MRTFYNNLSNLKIQGIIFFFFLTTTVLAQGSVEVKIKVTDEAQQGISEVTVSLKNALTNYIGLTDESGEVSFQIIMEIIKFNIFISVTKTNKKQSPF